MRPVQIGVLVAAVLSIVGVLALSPVVLMPREYRGVWVSSFENSAFYEGASAIDPASFSGEPDGWLVGNGANLPSCGDEEIAQWDVNRALAYEIEFEGTRRAGPSGHLSSYPAEYQIDTIKSVSAICDQG